MKKESEKENKEDYIKEIETYNRQYYELNENLKKENNNLKKKLEETSILLNDFKSKYNKLSSDYDTHKKEEKKLKENYELVQKNLIEKEKNLESKEKTINKLENAKKANDEENKKNEIKLNSMKKELECAQNEIIELKNKIKNLEKYSNTEKMEKLENLLQLNETKNDFLVKQAEEYYDVVIDICSINALRNEGWEIKYNKERKDVYEKIIGEQTIKIGVIGLNNVGKSFLLSKIVRVEIPTGYSVETKGISIKYSQGEKGEEEGICILDSAGFETPLLKENIQDKKNEKEVLEKEVLEKEEGTNNIENIIKLDKLDAIEDELSRDKAQTERFIEQLVISLSDMIILVVGKLTRTEQRLITRIKNLSKKNEKNKIKSIIIVHNLAQYHKIMEVEKHIKNYLSISATFELLTQKVFGLPQYKDRNYFVEKSYTQDDLEVFHYIMAKEGTEAGDFYNNLTIELIKQQYNQFNNRRKIDIPLQITKLFSELSSEIIGEKMECETLKSDENKIVLKKTTEEKKANEKFIIQNAYIDQDGNYLANKGKYEPNYSLYFYKELNEEEDEEENYLLLRLELPGNIIKLTARSTDPKLEKYRGIIIKGIKERDKFKEQEKNSFKEISDNRIYDEFTYFIELKRNLELSKKVAKGNTEIYKIKFDYKNKEKKKKATSNDFQNSEEDKRIKEVEGEMIACGVYIMKFPLTENSFI